VGRALEGRAGAVRVRGRTPSIDSWAAQWSAVQPLLSDVPTSTPCCRILDRADFPPAVPEEKSGESQMSPLRGLPLSGLSRDPKKGVLSRAGMEPNCAEAMSASALGSMGVPLSERAFSESRGLLEPVFLRVITFPPSPRPSPMCSSNAGEAGLICAGESDHAARRG